MAKPPVLGNDPFQRGAAARADAPAPEPAAAAAKPVSPAAPKASTAKKKSAPAKASPAPAAAQPKPGKARSAHAGSKGAKPAAKAKPAVEAPVAPAAKPAAKAKPAVEAAPAPVTAQAKPQPKVRAGETKPAAKAERKTAAKAKVPVKQPKVAEKVAARPEPAPSVPPARAAEPEARPPVEAAQPVAEPQQPTAEAPRIEAERPLERTAVIEGEVVAVHPPRSLFVPEPPPPSAAPSARPSLLAQLRHGTLSTLQGLAQATMESFAARRGQATGASSWLDRAGAVGAGVASATAPVFETARALLPPAVGAARSVASAVTSGRLVTEAAGAAAEAASAVRQAARRSEPSMLEFDLFGEDPGLTSRLEPIFDFLHDRYFRVAVHGASQVPAGPCLVVCNHAGVLPIDGPMMRTVLRRECGRTEARWLVEDSIFHAPFLGDLLNRLGAVRACPENAERLLSNQTAVVVFPEGVLGSGKTVRERYRLQRFGRGGFVKLAMRAGVPIVPAAIVGAEDTQPLLARLPVRGLGSLPITPTFPWFGPLGLMPFPSKWTVSFLPPVDVRAHGAAGAEDLALVGRITEEVRGALQLEIDRLLAEREPKR